MDIDILIYIFIIIWLIEFSLFAMQRASLLIARRAVGQLYDPNQYSQLLLPKWFPLTWIFIISKWCLLFYIFWFINWKTSIFLAIISFIASIKIPIPYSVFNPIFKYRLKQLKEEFPEDKERFDNIFSELK